MIDLLVRRLSDAGVEFIVVGGFAAVLHRAPVTTVDLDIVHSRAPDNVARLLGELRRLDARLRDLAGRVIEPTVEMLSGAGQVLLTTSLGPLDCLGALHGGEGFFELLPHTEVLALGDTSVRALDLPTLIDIKTRAGRLKDRLVVPILMAELRRRSR